MTAVVSTVCELKLDQLYKRERLVAGLQLPSCSCLEELTMEARFYMMSCRRHQNVRNNDTHGPSSFNLRETACEGECC